LGDLLFQVVFHAQIGAEQGLFDFETVASALCDKMIARHPHVFGDKKVSSADHHLVNWEAFKQAERAQKFKDDPSVLADIPHALPALSRAHKLSKRAARVGFDWPEMDAVFDKLKEETLEAQEAIVEGDERHIAEEIGDMLFVVANLARKAKIDPEEALRQANLKFERRFRWIETHLASQGRNPEQSDLEEMEGLWLRAKQAERNL
jgi:tetrapyrrole methylase family protein/MazG family protein/ATP diphosphatase